MADQTKVLIVEDDKFLSELISTKLDKEGFDIAVAGDGETGLKKAEEFMPQIVLLDIMLPGMDGFEVLDKMKNNVNNKLKKIPVIILSNFGQESKVERGLQLGAADYLVKANFTTGEIVDKIKEVLAKQD